MPSHTPLLVVRPQVALSVPIKEEHAHEVIHRLLGTRPLTLLEKTLYAAGRSPWLSGLGGLLIDALHKSARVDQSMPLLVELFAGLAQGYPELIEPELRTVGADDLALASLRALGSSGFALNTVYVAHPHDPTSYVQLAHFHRYLLDEKRAEFERIAVALGAKEIRMVENDSANRSAKVEGAIAAPIQGVEVEVGARARRQSSEETSFQLTASYDEPSGMPYLPENLRWLPSEPQWQSMVEARVGSTTVRRRRITFRYSSDYSVNAGLVAKVQGLGFSAGGSFEAMRSVEVDYEVEFYPKPKSE